MLVALCHIEKTQCIACTLIFSADWIFHRSADPYLLNLNPNPFLSGLIFDQHHTTAGIPTISVEDASTLVETRNGAAVQNSNRVSGVGVFCCAFLSTIFCHYRQQQNGSSGKTELSLNTDGKAGGIKVNRKTKTRFEGYARNMTGRHCEAVKRRREPKKLGVDRRQHFDWRKKSPC